ncbi:DUF1328 domain-containing protein [Ancylobacter sp. 6x-1]|uniref:DUF1328 domain-containing protein n=1 Tax=Ancylobacter crimeensis TaxID=2579147 RepID=A0ABT0DA19_9HYPH|nr:DUF1328 domain-containing protein [Ancylobacter crimeensis]MCK0196782.1 DUF1328 domain-containing protein [Ancylobacter crimeensis]
MLKYALFFLVISLLAGAIGLTNVSTIARRISLILFGVLFLAFLGLVLFALLVDRAMTTSLLVQARLLLA